MSIKSAVAESAKKMKNGVKSIEFEKSADGKGYVATHHMHSYEHPKNGMKHICTSPAGCAKHLKEHMPMEGKEEDGEDDL
jgi:hypothetical protein